MLIVVPRATTEKIIKKKNSKKKAIRELKCYTRKYLMLKKRHYGGIVELKKDLRYIKTYNNMTDINLTLSVIRLNVTD